MAFPRITLCSEQWREWEIRPEASTRPGKQMLMEMGNRNGNRTERELCSNRMLAFQLPLGKQKTIQKHEEEISYNELDAYKH